MIRMFVLLVILVSAGPAFAQPAALSDKITKMYQDRYEHYELIKRLRMTQYPVLEENRLRRDVIHNWFQENTAMRLRWVQRQGWSADYKAMFVRAVEWRRESFNGGADKLYRLSHKYLNAPNSEKYGYVALSADLLWRAAIAGHQKALEEAPHHPARELFMMILDQNRRAYYEDAVSGRLEETGFLASSYLGLPNFDEDLAKGFYWYLRLPISEIRSIFLASIEEGMARVSPAQRRLAESWIKSGYVPPM